MRRPCAAAAAAAALLGVVVAAAALMGVVVVAEEAAAEEGREARSGLQEWVRTSEVGGKVHECLELRTDTSPAGTGTGVFSTCDIPFGSDKTAAEGRTAERILFNKKRKNVEDGVEIFSIPMQPGVNMVTERDAQEYLGLGALPASEGRGTQMLAAWLWAQLALRKEEGAPSTAEDVHWAPYVDSLPTDTPPQVLPLYEPADLEHLQTSLLRNVATEAKDLMFKVFEQTRDTLLAVAGNSSSGSNDTAAEVDSSGTESSGATGRFSREFLTKHMTWPRFRTALALTVSRQHRIEVYSPQKDKWFPRVALLPFVDMFNYGGPAKRNVECFSHEDKQRFVCATTKAIQAGDELLVQYGMQDGGGNPRQLLVEYGFVDTTDATGLAHMAHDFPMPMFPLPLPQFKPQLMMAARVFQEMRSLDNMGEAVRAMANPFTLSLEQARSVELERTQLMALARLFALVTSPQYDEESLKERFGYPDTVAPLVQWLNQPLASSLENIALRMLSDHLTKTLHAYPTTMEEDVFHLSQMRRACGLPDDCDSGLKEVGVRQDSDALFDIDEQPLDKTLKCDPAVRHALALRSVEKLTLQAILNRVSHVTKHGYESQAPPPPNPADGSSEQQEQEQEQQDQEQELQPPPDEAPTGRTAI